MSYKYDEPSNISKDQFQRIITEGVIDIMCQAIVNAVHYISDYDWLLYEYGLLLKHPSVEVRGVTVSCIGHLARLHDEANKDQLLVLLKPLLSDSKITGRVEDAIDDINIFLV